MKSNKKIWFITVGIAAFAILIGVLFAVMNSSKDNKKEKEENKNILAIDEVVASKSSNYQQDYLYKFLSLPDFNSMTLGDSFAIDNSILENPNVDCSGTVTLKDNQGFKNWIFNTACQNDTENVKVQLLDTASISIQSAKKVQDGYLILTKGSKGNDALNSSLSIILVNDNLEIIWESIIQDVETPNVELSIYDSLEVEDGYYVVGYASNALSGDFQGISNDSSFAFLAKYDKTGNKVSLVPLGTPHFYRFLESPNQYIFLSGVSEIAKMSVKDNTVEILSLGNSDTYLYGVTEKYYYGYKDEQIELANGISTYGGKIEVLNLDGTNHLELSIKDIKNCSEHESCSISSIVGTDSYLFVAVDNQVYIMDYEGKILKNLDYSKIKLKDEEITSTKIDTILVLKDSYVIISNPTYQHVMVEEYDMNHNLLYRKNYFYETSQLLYSLSEEFEWFYRDQKLYRTYLIEEPRNFFATVTFP